MFLGTSVARRPKTYSYFATGMNGDEDFGEDITMKGDKFHYVQKPTDHETVQLNADPPEKVLTLEPKIGVHHTTFMTQTKSNSLVQLEETGDGKHETEKTHVLEPIATRAYFNDPGTALTYPTQRTAFYV